MTEPTYRQHQILNTVREQGGSILMREDADLEQHWVLVRAGYLQNLVVLPSGWRFRLTEEAEQYLKSFSEDESK